MRTVVVIIDFDNYFGSDISKLNSESIEYSFSEIVNLCEEKFSNLEKIYIRLYGGWYKEKTLTKQASTLQQLLFTVNVFPKVKNGKIINGSVEMVSELHGVNGFIWGYTHKEKDGIGRVRIDFERIDELCSQNRRNCPKFILYNFTDSKEKTCSVTSCSHVHKNVFKGIEQKMVDTLIACDILSLSDDSEIIGLVVVSDDQDHFPSIALAAEKQKAKRDSKLEKILLLVKNEMKFEFIAEFLSPFNINIILYVK